MQLARQVITSTRFQPLRACRLMQPIVVATSPTRGVRLSVDQKKIEDTSNEYLEKLMAGDRTTLARSITLVESLRPEKRVIGTAILAGIMRQTAAKAYETDHNRHTLRIGLSGPPGAGKSSLIETLGCRLTNQVPWGTRTDGEKPDFGEARKIAVLAVDPSSSSTGGSLLADKTRMSNLSRDPRAFIRPSPNAGHLGGVARATNETVVLCEGCGYDTVLVETVGVGQAEFAVADMVDMFVLILPPAGGDELQGIKRGIVEVADLVVINKADGDLLPAARRMSMEYGSGLKYMPRHRKKWIPKVIMVSSHKGTGFCELWETVLEFKKVMVETGELQQNRKNQLKTWMWGYLNQGVMECFRQNPAVQKELKQFERKVISGEVSPGEAAEVLMSKFLGN